jgi:tRNA(adenine34) deaminase
MFSDQDRSFMKMALDEAKLSFNDNKVINTINVTSHAEINAIIDASKNTNNYRLNNAKMYVTLEPCHMCAKAIIDARIDEIIFAAPEPKTGSIISIDNIYERIKFNHKTSYKYGLLQNESSNLLKKFFKTKR